jgi:hypothetical protein
LGKDGIEVIVAQFSRHTSGIYLERLRTTSRNSQDSLFNNRDSNEVSTEYKADALQLR